MKNKFLSIVCFCLLAQPALSQVAVSDPCEIADQNFKTFGVVGDHVRESARALAIVMSAWNPEVSADDIEQTILVRAKSEGVRRAIVLPAYAMLDAAAMVKAREAIGPLLPIFSSLEPANRRKWIDSLGVQSVRWDSMEGLQGLRDMRRDTIGKIRDTYGLGKRESDMMPALRDDWRRIDPTGLAGALLGPGSRMHILAGIERQRQQQMMHPKSMIFGMTSTEISACYERCANNASGAAAAGAWIGGAVGGVVAAVAGGVMAGVVTGGAAAIPAAIADGAWGVGVGGGAGAAYAGSISAAYCSSSQCDHQTPRTSESSRTEKPSQTPTSTTPTGPKPDSPSGGAEPDKSPTTGSDSSGGATSGGSEPCDHGSQTCDSRVNPDDDRGTGPRKADDTSGWGRHPGSGLPPKVRELPKMNPIQDFKTLQGLRRWN